MRVRPVAAAREPTDRSTGAGKRRPPPFEEDRPGFPDGGRMPAMPGGRRGGIAESETSGREYRDGFPTGPNRLPRPKNPNMLLPAQPFPMSGFPAPGHTPRRRAQARKRAPAAPRAVMFPANMTETRAPPFSASTTAAGDLRAGGRGILLRTPHPHRRRPAASGGAHACGRRGRGAPRNGRAANGARQGSPPPPEFRVTAPCMFREHPMPLCVAVPEEGRVRPRRPHPSAAKPV